MSEAERHLRDFLRSLERFNQGVAQEMKNLEKEHGAVKAIWHDDFRREYDRRHTHLKEPVVRYNGGGGNSSRRYCTPRSVNSAGTNVATDVTELITRLDHYKAALNQGAQRLRSDMKEMERRKATLKSELDGNFARSFYRSWEQSERVFNDYMTGSEQLIRLFDERIAALRRFDTSEG